MTDQARITDKAANRWFVYILRCADDSLYTGMTNNVARRVRQHNAGTASRYTRSRLPVELVYQEFQPHRSGALQREAAIKRLTRSRKLLMIQAARQPGESPPFDSKSRATQAEDCTSSRFNLLADLPRRLPDELFATLLKSRDIRIERIVSHGHASPDGFWFDQDQHEWVIVLQGAARIRIEGEEQPIEMKSGDFVNLPAHTRHWVEWTTPDEPTVWLAVFYG